MKTRKLFNFVAFSISLSMLIAKTSQAQTYYFVDTVTCFNWDIPNTEWDSTYREIYSYTPSGKISEYIFQYYSTQFDNSMRYTRTYNSNDDLADEIHYNWSGTAWDPTFRYLFFYNTSNKLINRTNLQWNGTAYDSLNRELRTYDVNGYNNSITYQSYSSGWMNGAKILFTNDANGNPLNQKNLTWNNITSTWDSTMQIINTYNSANLLTTQIQQFWNGISNQWENNTKRVTVYNTSNQEMINYFLFWNAPNWDSSSRILYTYDVNGNKSSIINQTYQGGTWQNSFKNEYLFNSNNDQIRSFSYNWNAGNWEPSTKDTTMYNANNLKTEWILGYYNVGVYENSQRCIYTYESITFTGIEENPYQALGCLMPNPYAGQFVACDLKPEKSYVISLFDMQGRLIMQQQVNNGSNGFSLNVLPENGLYIVQVQSEDGAELFTKKLIINQ